MLASAQSHYSAPEGVGHEIPVVFFDRIPGGCHGPAISSANLEATREATNYLINLGHHDIAMIAGHAAISTSGERMGGFRQAMGAAGLPVREEYSPCGSSSLEGGYECGLKLMRLPVPPTAIIAGNLKMTLGLMWALHEMHIRSPKQVSIIGFDDVELGTIRFNWAAMCVPKLTAIAQFGSEMGREVVRLMMRSLRHPHEDGPEQEIVRLRTELRIRESAAPPPTARRNTTRLFSWSKP
jgi:DNA-binding LacI/PurR family transcriptional regulator